jgi:hypothetical protein
VIGLALDGVGLGTTASPGAAKVLWVGRNGARWQRVATCRRWRCPAATSRRASPGAWPRRCCTRLGPRRRDRAALRPVVGEDAAAHLGVRACWRRPELPAHQQRRPLVRRRGRRAGPERLRQRDEAEAAIALERGASDWLERAADGVPSRSSAPSLDLRRWWPAWLDESGDDRAARRAALLPPGAGRRAWPMPRCRPRATRRRHVAWAAAAS